MHLKAGRNTQHLKEHSSSILRNIFTPINFKSNQDAEEVALDDDNYD